MKSLVHPNFWKLYSALPREVQLLADKTYAGFESGRDNKARFVYPPAMSTAEIINELPKLPEADRRAIREVLLGIANEDPDVALCNQTAMEGAKMLDQWEIGA